MSDTKEYVLNKLSSVLDVPKDPRSLEELLSLPAWTLLDVEKEDAVRLDDKLNVKTILDLVNVDLNGKKAAANNDAIIFKNPLRVMEESARDVLEPLFLLPPRTSHKRS